jgi:hypothetical protein
MDNSQSGIMGPGEGNGLTMRTLIIKEKVALRFRKLISSRTLFAIDFLQGLSPKDIRRGYCDLRLCLFFDRTCNRDTRPQPRLK